MAAKDRTFKITPTGLQPASPKPLSSKRSVADITAKREEVLAKAAEAEFEVTVRNQLEYLRASRDAKALLAAEGWEEPPVQGSWAEQMQQPDQPLNWIIEGLLFEGANAVLNAVAKSGKTSLLINTADSMLSGEPLFGHFVVNAIAEGRSIAWWNAELAERQAKSWLHDFDFSRPEDFYPLHLRGYMMPFDVHRVEDWAVEWLSERRVSVWMLDPRSALYTGEENSNTELSAWLAAIDRIKRRAGVETVILVHHVSETATADSDELNAGRLLRGRGASRQEGWADVIWSYSGRFDEPRYLAALGRDVDVAPFGGLVMESGSRKLRFTGQRSTPSQDRKVSLAYAAYEAVTTAGEPVAAMALQAQLPGTKPNPKREAVAYAVSLGWLDEAPGPRNSKLYSPGAIDPRKRRLNVTTEDKETGSANPV
ncbi:AAA family ATPase [Microbacterium sp. UCD-TDU]|uniref:ATP-binding protein n=1 Tax=Microbacterium sp. UCD-TDU TaxID=1247714 RepID=UPI00034CA6A0|nr:AAA family ATPase [Microbacterium sp. UCD-TDU]EYT59715.1 hypothetical protein D514_0108120 [Microbacterium sp. UCD-TDU]